MKDANNVCLIICSTLIAIVLAFTFPPALLVLALFGFIAYISKD